MIRKSFYILCFFFVWNSIGQTSNIEEKFELTEEVKETSGLIFFNDKIITHNDSGDIANLYEIDTNSGAVTRTINIINATNVDWEDISQDDTHIYIADIGNNSGNRQDLKIYKVLKSDYLASTNVTAEIISFSYEDQTDFTSQPNNTNFDAEAIGIYLDNIVIFTKHWIDFQTDAYIIPKSPGNHTAQKVSSFNAEGLITGADFNGEHLILTGYNSMAVPFLVFANENRPPGVDFFGGFVEKINLIGDAFLENGSQIEGITFFASDKCYISREFSSANVGGMNFEFPQKLYEFTSFIFNLLSSSDYRLSKTVEIAPNPVKDTLSIILKESSLEISSVIIYNSKGQEILIAKGKDAINVNNISNGIYFAKIQFVSGQSVVKRIIKE